MENGSCAIVDDCNDMTVVDAVSDPARSNDHQPGGYSDLVKVRPCVRLYYLCL